MKLDKEKEESPVTAPTSKVRAYTKQQFLSSNQRNEQKDLLQALLVDGQLYTHKQVDEILSKFLRKVAE